MGRVWPDEDTDGGMSDDQRGALRASDKGRDAFEVGRNVKRPC